MIPYNKNYFNIRTIINSFFISKPSEKLRKYFSDYTGKKYILITNSCRSALYLTYRAINIQGDVITSPLTCKVAIDPMIAAGYNPVFHDIQSDLLILKSDEIQNRITEKTRGFQLIHHGGVAINVKEFINIARINKIFVIEDCAQGLFSTHNSIKTGTLSDYACFSLIKNAKGIGGGILATNNEKIYLKAKSIQNEFKKMPFKLVLFRIIRSIIDNKRNFPLCNLLYKKLLRVRDKNQVKIKQSFVTKLYQPCLIETRIAYKQIKKAEKLFKIRQEKGLRFLKLLQNAGYCDNYMKLNNLQLSFTKFFIVSKKINSLEIIKELNKNGIEAMHLEHKYLKSYQERFDFTFADKKDEINKFCPVYIEILDHIISIPFYESMKEKDMNRIIEILNKITNHDSK